MNGRSDDTESFRLAVRVLDEELAAILTDCDHFFVNGQRTANHFSDRGSVCCFLEALETVLDLGADR